MHQHHMTICPHCKELGLFEIGLDEGEVALGIS